MSLPTRRTENSIAFGPFGLPGGHTWPALKRASPPTTPTAVQWSGIARPAIDDLFKDVFARSGPFPLPAQAAEAPVPPEDPVVLAKQRAERSLDKVLQSYREMFGIDLGRPEVVMEPGVNNAWWDGTKVHIGTGDGQMFSPLNSVDVLGRETAHAINQRTAQLRWSGESGAIASAMADIFACAAEWKASQTDPSEVFDYELGEDVYTPGTPGDAVRYLDDPTRDGYSIDNTSQIDDSNRGDLYKLSGIVNKAWALAAKEIGVDKASQIYFRGLTRYMDPTTNFAKARLATVKAAEDMFGAGSAQATAIANAWTAVGVG